MGFDQLTAQGEPDTRADPGVTRVEPIEHASELRCRCARPIIDHIDDGHAVVAVEHQADRAAAR